MDPVKIYDLNQVAYLDTEGLRYDRTEGSGRNVSFVFDTLTPEQASALFARPEFDLCRRFSPGVGRSAPRDRAGERRGRAMSRRA